MANTQLKTATFCHKFCVQRTPYTSFLTVAYSWKLCHLVTKDMMSTNKRATFMKMEYDNICEASSGNPEQLIAMSVLTNSMCSRKQSFRWHLIRVELFPSGDAVKCTYIPFLHARLTWPGLGHRLFQNCVRISSSGLWGFFPVTS